MPAVRPALLIDVDGVLSPFGADCPEGYSLVPLPLLMEPIAISPQNATRLERLAQTFDLVWCTGWEHDANEHLLEHHNLPAPLEVIEFWKPTDGVEVKFSGIRIHTELYKTAHWKMPWVDAWAKKTSRPLAWIDDEVGTADWKWAEKRTVEEDIPTLVLKIKYDKGLGDEHVEELEEWWNGAR